ncbi:hypothetical protein Lal_00001089 [Lupinus albus]|nr:hypothetical protein Lal_00001089 [Lupinus albus]
MEQVKPTLTYWVLSIFEKLWAIKVFLNGEEKENICIDILSEGWSQRRRQCSWLSFIHVHKVWGYSLDSGMNSANCIIGQTHSSYFRQSSNYLPVIPRIANCWNCRQCLLSASFSIFIDWGTSPRSSAAAWEAWRSNTLRPFQSGLTTFPCFAIVSTAAKIASWSFLSKIPPPTIITGFLAFEIVLENGWRPSAISRKSLPDIPTISSGLTPWATSVTTARASRQLTALKRPSGSRIIGSFNLCLFKPS